MESNRALVVRTSGPEETRNVGIAFARSLPAGATLSLEGPLGAGKTVLVHGLCEGWGVVDPVTSPSYTLQNEYRTAVNAMPAPRSTIRTNPAMRSARLRTLPSAGTRARC